MNYVESKHEDVLKTCTVLVEGPHSHKNPENNPGVLKYGEMLKLLAFHGAQVNGIESANNELSRPNNQLAPVKQHENEIRRL